ncbi:glycosyltransferase [Acidiferrimicrobium sp. IK]|uniref:glycosyltransferase family 2 protein n=1 Tax=Acidiferrimicrobium sp. IK TaxID=2871700 RepID=UPI0021CB4DA6|nr:glycosyltransferase family 2 protein [Acidiferrimicrobium sp. IK]MCU4183097.1 glycosyltransferase [Acidiferrimicrobium sp. IK]
MPTEPDARTTVVIATRDRREELLRTLQRLRDLPERPPVVVVDNASSDGTPAAAREFGGRVEVLALPANLGAAARTVGVRAARTPLIAFCDDDSWWAPGALRLAAARFDKDPALGLLAARVLVGPDERLDPTSAVMAAGDLDESLRPGGRGRRGVTGFLACGAVVRARAFCAVGGFEPHLMIGGEEEMVALDLAAAGWKLVYEPEVVAHHYPSRARHAASRNRHLARNLLLTAWLRYPPAAAARRAMAAGPHRPNGREALWALRSAPWAASRRRPVPAGLADVFVG